jgi:DHA2 family multidrug resistance protein-like MFS transporter
MQLTDGLPPAQRRRALLTIAISVGISVLGSALPNIALPSIAVDLGVSPAASIWVVNAYQIAIVVSLLPFSSLGDIYGYRRVYIAGLVVFILASAACALAPSLPLLAAARVGQGLGAAGLMSVNTALIRYVFPRSMLGRGLGINALIVATASALGPTIAAGLLLVGHWPLLFAVNVPLGVIAFAMRGSLPESALSGHRFDIASAVMNAATFGLFIAAVDGLGHGQAAWIGVVELVGTVAVGFVFVRRQLSLAAPMLPVDLLRKPMFSLSVATSVCSFCAQTSGYVALPFLFQAAGGASAIGTGLLMTPWPLTVAIVAPISGRLSDRYPAGILGGLGLAAMSAGLALLATMPAHPAAWEVAWRMSLAGAGFALFQAPNNRQMLGAVPRERSGASSGMLSTSRLFGQTLGAALVGVVFHMMEADGGGAADGAHVAVLVGAGFAAIGTVISVARLRA